MSLDTRSQTHRITRPLWLAAALTLLLVVGLAACGTAGPGAAAPQGTAQGDLAIVDALGREVQLPGPPQKIVIGGKANFMITDAVYLFPGAQARVTGLTKASQAVQTFVALLEPDAEAKTRFTVDSSAEEFAAAQPDLVLLKRPMQASLGDGLSQLGIPVVYVDLETPAQYERDLQILGQVMGDPARADEIWAYYRDILDRVAAGTADLQDEDKPRILLLQYSDKGGEIAFQVPPAGWIQTQLVELAGGTPVWTAASEAGGWTVVNLEQIAAWNPDQIYVVNYFGSAADTVAQLQADPQWAELAAVQAGDLIPFVGDTSSWDQPDTRWGLGLLWLAQHVHPDRFADVDLQAEVTHFFQTFYGLDQATIDSEILSRTGPLVTP